MRIMIDTNILISIYLFPTPAMRKLVDALTGKHTIVLPSYVIDELKTVMKRKFPTQYHREFLLRLGAGSFLGTKRSKRIIISHSRRLLFFHTDTETLYHRFFSLIAWGDEYGSFNIQDYFLHPGADKEGGIPGRALNAA